MKEHKEFDFEEFERLISENRSEVEKIDLSAFGFGESDEGNLIEEFWNDLVGNYIFDTLEEKFDALTHYLMNYFALVVGENAYRIIETEIYYNDGEGHDDPYVHKDPEQLNPGKWYFNGFGLDITFGDKEKNIHGGILIRGIKKLGEKEKYISGPSNVLKELFSSFQTVISDNYGFTIKELPDDEIAKNEDKPPYKSTRIGLTKKDDDKEDFYNAKYRYLVDLSYEHKFKEKEKVLKSLIKDGVELPASTKDILGYNIKNIMIPDHKTNKLYLSGTLKEWYNEIAADIEAVCNEFGYKPNYLDNTNDIWARDYMPIQVSKDKLVQYSYNPDYLGDEEGEKLKTNPEVACNSLGLETIKTDIIIDGGNIVKSDNSIIMTDKVVWENRKKYSEKKLLIELYELFEVDKIVLVPWDEDCEYGHVDGMLRFIDNDTVLISGFYEKIDLEFKKKLLKPLEKANISYEWLRVADKETEDNAFYINFLQTKDFILVPGFDKITDAEAVKQIAKYYKDFISPDRVRTIDMSETIEKGGALNCISWNIETNS